MMESALADLPIIPHENVADVDCCGCLMVRVRNGLAEILCNECGAAIRTVPIAEVHAAMSELAGTEVVCSAVCPFCRAINTFPGVTAIMAFTCRECGEGVGVEPSVQQARD